MGLDEIDRGAHVIAAELTHQVVRGLPSTPVTAKPSQPCTPELTGVAPGFPAPGSHRRYRSAGHACGGRPSSTGTFCGVSVMPEFRACSRIKVAKSSSMCPAPMAPATS